MLMDYQAGGEGGGGGYAMGGMRMPGGSGAQNAERVNQDRAERYGGGGQRGPPNNSAAASGGGGGGFKSF